MTDDVLAARDLCRVFPGFRFGPLSLRLRPGQVYGLLGPNGAGKTTLLNLIALQLRSTAGTLTSADAQIRWGDSAWKARFSYIWETPSFYAELTVAQTLELAGQLYDHWDPVLAEHPHSAPSGYHHTSGSVSCRRARTSRRVSET